MSLLTSLIEEVKQENLTKSQLEDLYQRLTDLFVTLQLELGDLEQSEARYYDTSEEKSAIAAERKWRASEKGQLLIERKRQDKALSKLLSATKHRIYGMY